MSTLVTIGDFSKMTYVTVKALRHYHDIGLLAPAAVDPQNGYRLYGTDQVVAAQTIRRLRELDMPTEEIRAVLDAPDERGRDEVIGAHLARMEAELERTRATVGALRVLLEDEQPSLPVTYRVLAPVDALAIREVVRFDEAEAWAEGAYAALHERADREGLETAGPDGALYEDGFFVDGRGEVTAFVPVGGRRGRGPGEAGRVQAIEVPGFAAASSIHTGDFATLDVTYHALGAEVAKQGIAASGPMREHYLDDTTIEVCWPITRVP